MSSFQPEGQWWSYCFCQLCVFVRSFDTFWFSDSHSWNKPYRILLFGTMIDPIKTLPGIVRQLPSRIFDLVITYFLSLEFLPRLWFLNQTTQDLAFWHNDRSYQDLVWDCSSTSLTYIRLGDNLFSVIVIVFWTRQLPSRIFDLVIDWLIENFI